MASMMINETVGGFVAKFNPLYKTLRGLVSNCAERFSMSLGGCTRAVVIIISNQLVNARDKPGVASLLWFKVCS